ncbi:chemokine-like factor [Gracilinanus agilis]|uniref:chemokine-like factor n=1 Tax=Gracilinanus agilis TaxID=191870 RepID=UPI001CFE8018|nr:chemokine-like factor [Gracilinanus agilis]
MDSTATEVVETRTAKEFLFSIKGIVKIMRLRNWKALRLGHKKGHLEKVALEILTVTSLILFIIAQAPETYIVVTSLEAIIGLFFLTLYVLRLDLLWKCLFWPLLDILNSAVGVVFLLVISVLAMVPETQVLTAIGGIIGIVATVFTITDAALIYRKLMFNPSGAYEKKHSHDKKHRLRRSHHSRHSHHSHHSHQSYHARYPQETNEV